jgi:sugar phosphate permease
MSYPESAGAAPTQVRFRVLAFISSLSVVTYLDRVCISRVQNDIKHDLLFNDVEMGYIFGAFLIGYGLFEVPAGWMGDMWGSRRVLTRIVLWWSLFTAFTGSIGWLAGVRDYQVYLLGWQAPLLFLLMLSVRFLFGCGEAGAYPNMARIVRRWFPYRERGVAQGVIWMSARLGGAIAAVVIGRLTLWLGWKQAFWVLAFAGFAWCIAFYAWFRDSPADMPQCNDAERDLILSDTATPQGDEDHGGAPWWRILTSLNTLWLCLCGVFVNLAWYFIPTWQPRYFEDVFKISMDKSEILTGLPFLSGAAGALLGGRLSDSLVRLTGSRRWGRSLIGFIGFGGAGVSLFTLGLVQEAWQAVTLLCLFTFINDLAVPVIWATCTDIGGRFAGTFSALINTAGCVGGFLSPVLTGILLGQTARDVSVGDRWPAIFALYAGAGTLSGLCWLFVDAGKPIVAEENT